MTDERSSKTTTSLFGHEKAEAALLADAAAKRLPHGLIISGPRGVGKATLAYRLARALLSGSGSMEMSEDNPVFRRVAAESHSDLLVLEPAFDEKKDEKKREISVEQARGVAGFLSLTAGESEWRVVIVDTADELNNNSANAILKILEEPPPKTILLLISHNPGRLLPTIRSRCRMLKLTPLTLKDFERAMTHLLPDLDEERLVGLSELCGYAPGLALEYYEQGALDMYDQVLDLLAELPALDSLKLFKFSEEMSTGERHAKWQLLTRLMLVLFDRLAKTAAGVSLTPINRAEAQALARLSMIHPAALWATKWQQCLEQFSLAERLHLDYKQVIIAFFHSIATKEGLQLGSTAA